MFDNTKLERVGRYAKTAALDIRALINEGREMEDLNIPVLEDWAKSLDSIAKMAEMMRKD